MADILAEIDADISQAFQVCAFPSSPVPNELELTGGIPF